MGPGDAPGNHDTACDPLTTTQVLVSPRSRRSRKVRELVRLLARLLDAQGDLAVLATFCDRAPNATGWISVNGGPVLLDSDRDTLASGPH